MLSFRRFHREIAPCAKRIDVAQPCIFEGLEPRILLSTITWINRGMTSDRFDEVFGANANAARAVVDAVIDAWERVIVSFNYTSGTDTFDLTVRMNDSGTGFGGAATVTQYVGDKPKAGRVTINRGNDTNGDGLGDGAGWYLDPTPEEYSEFNGEPVNAFVGLAPMGSPASGLADLYSLVAVEMTHAMGLINHSNSLYQSSGYLTNTDIPDQAHGGGTGFYWVFNGPSIDHLMTSFDSGSGGTDFAPGVHSAGPTAANQPVNFAGKTYQGAADTGNATYFGSRRYLVPNTMRLILQDAYGYTTVNPARFGTFYSNLNATTGELLVRGGADDSNDEIRIWVEGNLLKVSVDVGDDIPGTGPLPGAGNLPAFVSEYVAGTISSITINAGGGNDFIWIDEVPGSKPVNIIAGDGDDTIFIANTTANLDGIRSWITVNGGTGNNTLGMWDDASGYDGIYNITDASVTRPGSNFEGLSYFNISNLTLHGSQQDNVFNVQTTLAGTALTIHGWAGNDQLHLAPTSRNLNSIAGPVTFNAGHGNDLIVLHDDGQNTGRTYTIDGDIVSRTGFGGLTYLGAEELRLLAGGGNDTFWVNWNFFQTPINIRAGGGNDTVALGAQLGTLSDFPAAVSFDGQSGSNTAWLWDITSPQSHTYSITGSAVTRAGFGGFSYQNVSELTLHGGSGNDIFNIAPMSQVQANIFGNDGIDQFRVNGNPLNTLNLHGDAPVAGAGDRIEINGVALAIYHPSGSNPSAGTINFLGGTIHFTGIEHPNRAIAIDTAVGVALETPNSSDIIDIHSQQAQGANIIMGTSGGVAFAPLWFTNVTNVTLNTGANDDISPGMSANDLITIHPNGLVATNLERFVLRGGIGQDRLIVNAGTYRFDHDARDFTQNLTVEVNTDGVGTAEVIFDHTQHLAGLVLGRDAKVLLTHTAGSPGKVIVTELLSISGGTTPGGQIDLTNNSMIIQRALGGLTTAQMVRAWVTAGYAAASWTGQGITSSTAAIDRLRTFAVGMGRNEKLGYTTFAGEPVTSNDTLVRFTPYGDANLDRRVDGEDFLIWQANFGKMADAYWDEGDYNFDQRVDGEDFLIWQANFGVAIPQSTIGWEDDQPAAGDSAAAVHSAATRPSHVRHLQGQSIAADRHLANERSWPSLFAVERIAASLLDVEDLEPKPTLALS